MSNPLNPGNLIGRGAQADVYLCDGQAVKLFHEGTLEDAVLYEADIQQRVYNAGLSAPRVYGVVTMENRFAILMEHVPGPSLGELMEKDRPRATEYLAQAVALQVQMHRTSGLGLPLQSEKLRQRITAVSTIPDNIKQRLLSMLDSIEDDKVVCHGDFHPYNIINTDNGLAIIDWVDASCGSAEADACRSYLLYLLHGKEAAEYYLQLYCQQSNIKREAIVKWLPILAGARLSEAGRGDDTALLLNLAHSALPGALPLDPAKGSVAEAPPVADKARRRRLAKQAMGAAANQRAD